MDIERDKHIHSILDYGLYVHDGIMSKYMTEYWDDNSVITQNKKSMYMDFFLDLVQNGFSKKEKIIELMYQNGMTEMEKKYLFNPWGGLPRYLIEKGKILLTIQKEATYMIVPNIGRCGKEDAVQEQIIRYINRYSPCTVADIMYFLNIVKLMLIKYWKK